MSREDLSEPEETSPEPRKRRKEQEAAAQPAVTAVHEPTQAQAGADTDSEAEKSRRCQHAPYMCECFRYPAKHCDLAAFAIAARF